MKPPLEEVYLKPDLEFWTRFVVSRDNVKIGRFGHLDVRQNGHLSVYKNPRYQWQTCQKYVGKNMWVK